MNDDDLTTDLGRELRDRSDAMYGSSLALADVQRKATSIRRRRVATAVGGAVAAVSLIVPTAALANHQIGHSTEPLPATQSVTPTPSPTTSAGQQPAPGVLDVSDLPTGDAPKMDYLREGAYHDTEGNTFDVRTRYTPAQFVWLEDGARVWRTTDKSGQSYVEIQDVDGTFHDPVRIASELSVNPSHSIAAWLTPSNQVIVWEGFASEPRPLGDPVPGSELRMGPVSGDDCSLACTVTVNVRDGDLQPWEVSDSGSQPLLDGGYLHVNDVSRAGLSVGLTEVTDFGSCSKLLGGGEFQGFSTCKHTLVSFSRDGQLVLADPAYHDGIGNGVIGMYDVNTGDLLFQRHSTEQAQSFYPEGQWEDATHVLVPVFQDGKWALVRVASDGAMEYAVPPAAGDELANPYVLPTGGNLPA